MPANSINSINGLYRLFYHPVFLSAFFSWFIAQLMKAIIDVFRNRQKTSRDVFMVLFWKTGGMPGSHSSLVAALATSIGFKEGVDSPLFILSFFYGILTVRDAMGVRRAAGVQAKVLNEIGGTLNKRFSMLFRPVKEIQGHTAIEVSVGILLGFFIALAFVSL